MLVGRSHTLPNRTRGNCRKCQTTVEVGEGIVVGPPWITLCVTCEEAGAAAEIAEAFAAPIKAVLRLLPGAERVAVVLASHLAGKPLEAYREALAAAGAPYDKSASANVAPLDLVPRLIEALEAQRASLSIDPDLSAALQARAAEVRGEVAEADTRLDALAAELRKRGFVLFPFQRADVRWLAPRADGMLGHEPGLGKTIMALCALSAGVPVLVVCPAGAKGLLLAGNSGALFGDGGAPSMRPRALGGWLGEAAKWRPDFALGSIDSRKAFRWPRPGEILVCNRETLPKAPAAKDPDPDEAAAWAALIASCPEGLHLIVDEAHYFKSPSSAGTRNLRALGRGVHKRGGRRWLATGTPMVNGDPDEIWTVLDLGGLAEEAFGTKARFKDLFVPLPNGGWNVDPQVPALLQRVMVRREKGGPNGVLKDLPPKRYEYIPVELDREATTIADELLSAIARAGISLDDYLAGNRLADDTAGDKSVPFELVMKVRKAVANAKIPAVMASLDALEEAGEPTLVMSMHRGPVDAAAARPGWARISGDETPGERAIVVDRFQKGELKGVGITIQAGGVNLTLTRAAISNFVDLGWNEATNRQAEDRIHRIGQTKSVLIRRFFADHPIERRVVELLQQKDAVDEASIRAATLGAETAAPEHALLASEAELTVKLARVEKTSIDRLAADKKKDDLRRELRREAPPARRPAASARERWAASALLLLDAASKSGPRGSGFSLQDVAVMAALAAQVRRGLGLAEAQWILVFRALERYRAQVGPVPATDAWDAAAEAAYARPARPSAAAAPPPRPRGGKGITNAPASEWEAPEEDWEEIVLLYGPEAAERMRNRTQAPGPAAKPAPALDEDAF